MSLESHFKKLNAPLRNVRWSWGGIRPDGAIILRAWQDKWLSQDGNKYVNILSVNSQSDDDERLGYQERLKHIELINNGAHAFLVMCRAEDASAVPRKIKSYDKNDVFGCGKIIELNGGKYIQVLTRLKINKIDERVETLNIPKYDPFDDPELQDWIPNDGN